MHYLTCYRCPLKRGCLYHEQVRAAIQNTPGVAFTSVQFKCDYKHGHLVPGAHVLVTLPNVAVIVHSDHQTFSAYRFNAVVMRWKGRKVQVWLEKPDQADWPQALQAKHQAVSVWPDQVLAIHQKRGSAKLCPICRKPNDQAVTRGEWNCVCTGAVVPDEVTPDMVNL